MNMEICGIRRVDIADEAGGAGVHGVSVFGLYPDDGVIGHACDKIFFSDGVAARYPWLNLKVGDRVSFDQAGKRRVTGITAYNGCLADTISEYTRAGFSVEEAINELKPNIKKK